MEICRLEHVTKVYHGDENICPVNDVSLVISPGDFVAIEGPSGIGKSTLLFLMGGLLQPTSGSLWLNGKDMRQCDDYELTALRSAFTGFVFQDTSLFPALTVLENIEFALALKQRKRNTKGERERALHLLAELGLSERANFLPYQLSIGQRRRVVVARALVNKAPLILADEPTNDLDPVWAAKVMKILLSVAEAGGAVVMVTHHLEWVELAKRRFRLQDGELISNNK